MVFLILHLPLGVLVSKIAILAQVHAAVSVTVGIYLAITSPRPELPLRAAAYIAGAEVLWRIAFVQTGARIFWETGKYATILILGTTYLRLPRQRPEWTPFIYLMLLAPAALLGLMRLPGDAFGHVRFHMAGPAALAVAALAISRMKLEVAQVERALMAFVLPLAATSAAINLNLATLERVVFGTQSNPQTSGGFGPNQVSLVLGFGALILAFLPILSKRHLAQVVFLVALAGALGAQAALTFSRGGVFGMALAGVVGAAFLVTSREQLIRVGVVLGTVGLLSIVVLAPRLNEYTHGALERRFTDIETTGRTAIAGGDLRLFAQYPVFGVGVGRSALLRDNHVGVTAHSEFTRLPAEHGVYGLLALVLMVFWAATGLARAGPGAPRGLATMLVIWAVVSMFHASTRVAAPSIAFALGAFGFRAVGATRRDGAS
ncbi:MAG: O-antigen ligase family protein [Deltaproteobacteria bacterium]|nr:O-antigen ligase family protein [Deltaproteobacteria bacterium]